MRRRVKPIVTKHEWRTDGTEDIHMATCAMGGISTPQIHDGKWAAKELRERGLIAKRRRLSEMTIAEKVALTEALLEAERRYDDHECGLGYDE